MAFLFRRGLVCFYCGRRSTLTQDGYLRKWKCESCEAVNHLDGNGDITDPPAQETVSNVRYGHAMQRSVSPLFTHSDKDLFCPTCIQNQLFYNQNLATYLPPSTDPQYAEYERKLPQYKKGLEERYPQVCEDCEPGVRARLREAGYTAKTDHLRRMMAKTRGGIVVQYRWRWRHIVSYAGMLGWWFAVAGFLLWNAFGAMATEDDGLRDDDSVTTLKTCVIQGCRTGTMDHTCLELARSWVVTAMVLGLLSVWWNPCWSAKLHGLPGRMTGLWEFYKLQMITTAMRILAWWVLGHGSSLHLDNSLRKAMHAVMLAFGIMVSFVSYRTVYLDTTPLVSFDVSDEPLISPKQRQVHNNSNQDQRTDPFLSNSSTARHLHQPFPINHLAQPTQPSHASSYQPPTPPLDDENLDLMDIDTPQKVFFPEPSLRTHQKISVTTEHPSPFYGNLPRAPKQEIRWPWTASQEPANARASRAVETKAQQYFKKGNNQNAPTEENFRGDPLADSPRNFSFAPPRFFASHGGETGLESRFSGIFSISDEPSDIQTQQRYKRQNPAPNSLSEAKAAQWTRIVTSGMLFLAAWAWSVAPSHSALGRALHYGAMFVAGVVATWGLSEALRFDKAVWSLSDVLVLVLELTSALFFAFQVAAHDTSDALDQQVVSHLPLGLLGFMIFQEMAAFGSGMRKPIPIRAAPNVDTAQTPSALASDPEPPALSPSKQRSRGPLPTQSLALALPISGIQQPLNTRSRSKLEKVGASQGFSGLSLGSSDTSSLTTATDKHGTWAGERKIVQRNTRSQNVPPWQRGTL